MTLMLPLAGPAVASETEDADEYKQPKAIALVAPLGVPQFAQKRWVRGATYLAVQSGGFAFGSYATNRMYDATEAEDFDGERTWKMLSFAGIATGTATWFISVVDASHYNQVQTEAYYQRAVEWEAAQAER